MESFGNKVFSPPHHLDPSLQTLSPALSSGVMFTGDKEKPVKASEMIIMRERKRYLITKSRNESQIQSFFRSSDLCQSYEQISDESSKATSFENVNGFHRANSSDCIHEEAHENPPSTIEVEADSVIEGVGRTESYYRIDGPESLSHTFDSGNNPLNSSSPLSGVAKSDASTSDKCLLCGDHHRVDRCQYLTRAQQYVCTLREKSVSSPNISSQILAESVDSPSTSACIDMEVDHENATKESMEEDNQNLR